MKRNAAEPEEPVARERPRNATERPPVAGAVHDVVVEVPVPTIRGENEPVPRVAVASLHAAAHRARHVVARDHRVAVVQHAGDRAWLFAEGAPKLRVKCIECMPGRILDSDGASRLREHLRIERRLLALRQRVGERPVVVARAQLRFADRRDGRGHHGRGCHRVGIRRIPRRPQDAQRPHRGVRIGH